MKNLRGRFFLVAALVAGLALSFQNCSKTNFNSSGDGVVNQASLATPTPTPTPTPPGDSTPTPTPTATPTPGTPPVCSVPPQLIQKKMKILFVVDVSGSNIGTQGPATDPQKTFRRNAMLTFLNEFRRKANYQWQFITFSTNVFSYLTSPATGLPSFTSDPFQMDSALALFLSRQDSGNTYYLRAFSEVTRNIINDPDFKKGEDPGNYVIIFISDGMPTDLQLASNRRFTGTAWQTEAMKIYNLHPNHVTLSAVYYGAPDSLASGEMRKMAQAMSGQFIDTNISGYDFEVDDLISIPGGACP